ncbi:hypothetical protein EGW08_001483 [Elysia chlorotica]|uniref:protein-serine/threonine phosphatase n=1 Tax=Elysia chlorotica TaxID=188477 RepID=A0A433UAF2_ELYCH|nr:hypothetical protein EGW08_001483 [Elysia chlorotica]
MGNTAAVNSGSTALKTPNVYHGISRVHQDNGLRNSVRVMDLVMFTQVAEITSCLYLSSAAAVRGEKVRSLGITSIINITLEIPNLQLPNLESVQIQVDDSPTARLGLYFDRCADKIHEVDRRGGRTLVHCVAGVSRSASICLAYLMKYHRMPLAQAYRHVKRRRPVIQPNIGFWRQLIEFERRVLGRTSVKMVQSSIGWVPDVYYQDVKPASSWYTSSSSRYGY